MSVQPTLSVRKRRWFSIIAVLLPFLFIFLLEALLRLTGYGHNTALFIRDPDHEGYYVMNQYASLPYFTNPQNSTQGYIEPFRIVKGNRTVRIFVLGESTTEGYPYFHNGSFHRWLEFRLRHVYPDVHFEIINVSLTAVNSYTVLDFGKRLIRYQPDAVLIYTGHNEYYGALGVGSTSHIANSRFLIEAVVALRKLRVVQLLENLIRKVRNQPSAVDTRKNLMERMAAVPRIAYQSPEFEAGIRQFRENMDRLCRLFDKKGIPVFLSDLVSNERDQPPFISEKGDMDADRAFGEADSAYRAENYVVAENDYRKAKEWDMLRFRAPEAMNEVIMELARRYRDIHLVNTQRLFRTHSPHGIIGHETILEHVHPNLYGYALMSDAFFQAIVASGIITSHDKEQMSFHELLDRMPVTKIDSLYGLYSIMMLETRWPFNKPLPKGFRVGNSLQEQLAGALSVKKITWLDAINRLFQFSMQRGDTTTACKAVEAAMLEYPLTMKYKIYAGRLNYELGHAHAAIHDFKDAYDLDSSWRNTEDLYLMYLKADRPGRAIRYVKSAIKMRPDDQRLRTLSVVVGQIIKEEDALMRSPGDESIRMQVARSYQSIGISDAATKYNH